MYYQVISQYTQALKNIDGWLDKAQQHAAVKKFDVDVLMTSRLAPDMGAFVYQVQSYVRLREGCRRLAVRAEAALPRGQ
jgi:uncharacterized protein